jgi:ParB family chromosome partitioning protein
LLNLPADVQGHIRHGNLSAGHARALINTTDPSGLAKSIIEKGLSVRETEKLAKETSTTPPRNKMAGRGNRFEKDADTRALEADLGANLKMAVSINHEPGGERGTLSIRYNTLEDLDNLCRTLSQMERE